MLPKRRSERSHRDVKERPFAILMHIGGNDEIDWHAQEGAVGKSDYKRTPDPQQLHQPENPRRIARQNVSNCFQGKQLVYVIELIESAAELSGLTFSGELFFH